MSKLKATCRSCGNSPLDLVLSLGSTPLANAFLTAQELALPEQSHPLDLAFCAECALVQITETVPPEKLFREYLYFSSYSDTLLQHARHIAESLIEARRLNANSLVIEIASNDGYMLQYFLKKNIPVLGIEPAINIARVAEEKGIPTICEFFGHEMAKRLLLDGKQADIILANNVLAHVPDLNGFVAGIRILLKDDGIAVIEVPYVKEMIDNCEFDTIYHEHLCYFSLTSLDHLFRQHGLIIDHVERIPIHGGSLRSLLSLKATSTSGNLVGSLLKEETAWGVHRLEFYQDFAQRVRKLQETLLKLLRELKQSGKRIAAYGAAAKGTTLLNHFGIGKELIDFVVDRSPYKQDRYMPGTHQPIYAPSRLLEEMPDYVLLLTWNFAEEILSQQQRYRQLGGRFIIPIPELKIL